MFVFRIWLHILPGYMQYSRKGERRLLKVWLKKVYAEVSNNKIENPSYGFRCIHQLLCSVLKFKWKIFNSMFTHDVQHRSTYISPGITTCVTTFSRSSTEFLLQQSEEHWLSESSHSVESAMSSVSPYHGNLIVPLKICLLGITFKAFHCLWHDRVSKMLMGLNFSCQSLSFPILQFGISFLCYIRCHIRNSCLTLRYMEGSDWQGIWGSWSSVFNHYHFQTLIMQLGKIRKAFENFTKW